MIETGKSRIAEGEKIFLKREGKIFQNGGWMIYFKRWRNEEKGWVEVIVKQKGGGGGGSNLNYGMQNKVVISINVPSPILMVLSPLFSVP